MGDWADEKAERLVQDISENGYCMTDVEKVAAALREAKAEGLRQAVAHVRSEAEEHARLLNAGRRDQNRVLRALRIERRLCLLELVHQLDDLTAAAPSSKEESHV